MAEGQSPENSPPAPPPPTPSSPSSDDDQETTPPSPSSDNQQTISPPPPPPPPDSSSSLAPPPQQQQQQPPPPSPPPPQTPSGDSSSSPPPPPSSQSQSQSQPPPSQSPPQQNNNGNGGSNNGGNRNNSPPSPPSRNSDNNSQSPPRSLAPPRSNGGSNSSNNDGPNMAAIIGLLSAAGLLFLVMILFCVCCLRKKKKKSKPEQMPYHGSNAYDAGQTGGDQYFNGAATQQQQEQQQHYNQNDHVVNLPPPPGTNGTNWMNTPPPPSPGNWQPMQSPPAPPMTGGMYSGEKSSNYSSGPYAPSLPPPHPSVALGFNKSTFTYEELAAATQGFSQDRLLGQGGFGYVHKGILPNGKEIAVKCLKAGSGQGDREFQAEVDIISRVHHRHLVSLVGYCSNAGGQRMLVYEFLPNDTLEFHLHGKNGKVMDWPTRLKIALGAAKGLAYLHEDCHPKIIHRDIKASNILLDLNFDAKVADFGLAKLSQDNSTHVSTRVMGTFGYLAPEYAASGKLTDKSDVFSYGVMLLELITGRRPVDLSGEMEDSLVDWARPLCVSAAQDGEYGRLADPFLENCYDPSEMARMVACAVAAVRHSGRRRPKMSQIVRTLEGDASLDDLNDGIKPSQSSQNIGSSGDGSSDYETGTYGAEMRKFRKVALDTRDYAASSDYGGTSEYGLDPSSSSSDEMQSAGVKTTRGF